VHVVDVHACQECAQLLASPAPPTWEEPLLLQLLLLSIWPLDWLPMQVADKRSLDPTALLVRPAQAEQQGKQEKVL
jgi:hypothetical protein